MADGVYSEVATLMSGIQSQLVALGQEMQQVALRQGAQQQALSQILHDLSTSGQPVTDPRVLDLLQRILAAVSPSVAAAVRFGWNGNVQTYPLNTTRETVHMSDFSLPDSDSATCTLQVLDADNNPFTPTTPPAWTPDSTTFVTLTVSADGMSATAVPVSGGGVGVTNVTIQVTNDDATLAAPVATSVTTTPSDAGTVTAVWADKGPTVAPAAPAAS